MTEMDAIEATTPEATTGDAALPTDAPISVPVANTDRTASSVAESAGILESHEAAAREQIDLSDAQLKQIEDEQKQAALVGDKIPFDIVLMEYDEKTSPAFYTKSRELAGTYSDIRQIRRDGNCFYRSVLVREVELLFSNPGELARFEAVCKGWQKRLIDLGFPDWTTADFCEYFFDWIKLIKNKEKTIKEVFTDLNDDHHSNYLVIFLRLIASGYLKENTADYEPFIDQGQSLAEYCQSEIEAMWKDADHLAITGLVNALGLGIRVEYMDQSNAPNGGWYYDFPPDQAESPKITLLYRPGHYDLIYKMDPVN